MRQHELDSKAEVIFNAAQNQMVALRASGNAEWYKDTKSGKAHDIDDVTADRDVPLDGEGKPDVDGLSDLYAMMSSDLSNEKSVASRVMAEGVMDGELRGNGWVVEYDPESGSVYAVFYSEDDDFRSYTSNWSKYDDLRDWNERIEAGAVVGYYGGDALVSSSGTSRLEPTMRVTNGEKLAVRFSSSLPKGYNATSDNDLIFTITLSDSVGHQYSTVYRTDDATNTLYKAGRTYYIDDDHFLLDDLTSEDTRFNRLYGSESGHGSDSLVPGDVLNVRLRVESKNRLIQPWTGSIETNGLFADASGEHRDGSGQVDTAVIECGRHLQNLDVLHGENGGENPNAHITKAVLAKGIAFGETLLNDDSGWLHTYSYDATKGQAYFNGNDASSAAPRFKPIYAPDLTEFAGGYDLSGRLYAISGLSVVGADGAGAGLFAQISGMSIHDVAFTGMHVEGTGDTGAIAGSVAGEGNAIRNCLVYLNQADGDLRADASIENARLRGRRTGGLVGAVESSAKLGIEGSLAATSQEGSQDSGGLVGAVGDSAELEIKTSYADSYQYGDSVTGGLVGTMSSTSSVGLDTCYAAGFLYGVQQYGLAAGRLASAAKVYTICSSRRGTLTYGTATEIASLENVYYLFGSTDAENDFSGTASLSEMASADLLEALGGDSSDGFTLAEATHAYNLNNQALGAYTYPRLSANHHYGDWAAAFASGALVYYERYGSGDTGFFGANAESSLRNDATIVGDGYGIVYRDEEDALPESVTVTLEGCDPITIEPSEGERYDVSGQDGVSYSVYPLPKELMNSGLPGEGDSFYRKVSIQATGAVRTDVYYLNPLFAMTQRYVRDGSAQRPELDSATWVSVRSPRHLHALSLFYARFADTARGVTFSQERDISFSSYDWDGYYRDGTGELQEQAPIGDSTHHFASNYNGNGFSIGDLSVVSEDGDCVGLFGYNEGVLSNIVLWCDYGSGAGNHTVQRREGIGTNSSVSIGLLVGYNGQTGTVSNCAVAGYYLAGTAGVIRAYSNSNLSIGGLVGTNAGRIQSSSIDCPDISLSALDAQVYAGGFAGANESTGSIVDCYGLGYLNVVSASGGNVRLCGFAGRNEGVLRACYCATSLSASGSAVKKYAFTTDGGIVSSCQYLGYGTFTYTGTLRSYDCDHTAPGVVATRNQLCSGQVSAHADSGHVRSYSVVGKDPRDSDGYPYRAVVKDREGDWVHYGDWQGESNLGTMGLFYWEHEEGGSNNGYHLTYLGRDEGEAIGGTTLCTSHDDGGAITEFGYGYFAKGGQSEDSVSSSLEGLAFSGAEDGPGDVNDGAKASLESQMPQYEFFPYTTRFSDSGDYLYLSSDDAAVREGTWTVANGADKLTFKVSPFFANAMSYGDDELALNLSGGDGIATDYRTLPGVEENAYEVRSLDQLQYINWNSAKKSVSRLVDAENYPEFPYLQYDVDLVDGTKQRKKPADAQARLYEQRPYRYWRQSHDVGAESSRLGTFTPIAGAATSAANDRSYDSVLYAWFGSSFDGMSYKLQNINLTSDSYTVGLFGTTAGAQIQNVIMYSDVGSEIVRDTSHGGQVGDKQGAYSIGGLIGVAYDYDTSTSTRTITNCAIAGYKIIDRSTTKMTPGEANLGGLIGVANVSLERCSSVVDVYVDCDCRNGHGYYGNYVRAGGLTGAAQYRVDNCYAGGEIHVSESVLNELYDNNYKPIDPSTVTEDTNVKRDLNTYVYVAGIAASSFTCNYMNFTGKTSSNDAKPTFSNCYTYVKLPKLERTIKGVSYIAAVADRYSNQARITVENCYYLDTFALSPVKGVGFDPPVYNIIPSNKSQANTYKMTADDFQDVLNGNLNVNRKIIQDDNKGPENNVTGKPTPITYDELASSVPTISGDWGKVTVTEGDGVSIHGKYSFPGEHPELVGKDYPFPTTIKQTDVVYDGEVNVHYGAWPLTGVYWSRSQASMDIFADMVQDGSDAQAEKEFELVDTKGTYSTEAPTVGDFEVDEPDLAQIIGVRKGSDEGTYLVKVRALGEGAVTVSEKRSASYASFVLRITAELEVVAEPATVANYRDGLASSEDSSVGESMVQLVARSKIDPSKEFSSGGQGSWAFDYDPTMIGVEKVDGSENLWKVTHLEHGIAAMAATFTYGREYHGRTYTVRANVPVKTYGVVGVSADPALTQAETFNEVARTLSSSGVIGENRTYREGKPTLPRNVNADFFLYESASDVDFDGKSIDGVDVRGIRLSHSGSDVDLAYDEEEAAWHDGARGFTVKIGTASGVVTDTSFHYLPCFLSYEGSEDVSDVTLRLELAHEEDVVSSGGISVSTPYSLSVSLGVAQYVATFDPNGGQGSVARLKTRVGDPVLQLPAGPTRTGYNFRAWKDGSGVEYQAGADYTMQGDTTFTAQWDPATYDVVFHPRDGVGEDRRQTLTYDTPATLQANAFTRDGYVFVGWSTRAGGAVAYQDGAEVLNLASTQDAQVDLYAYWEPWRTLTLDAQVDVAPDATPPTQTFAIASQHTVELEGYSAAASSDYGLLGWYTSPTGGRLAVNPDGTLVANVPGFTDRNGCIKVNDDKTLYAHWSPFITLLADFGDKGDSIRCQASKLGTDATDYVYPEQYYIKGTYHQESRAFSDYPFRYMLDGWFTEATGDGGEKVIDADGNVVSGKESLLTAGRVLHSRWCRAPEGEWSSVASRQWSPNGGPWWRTKAQYDADKDYRWGDKVQIDYATDSGEYLLAAMDLSTCVCANGKEENVISFGGANLNDSNHFGVIHFSYKKAASGAGGELRVWKGAGSSTTGFEERVEVKEGVDKLVIRFEKEHLYVKLVSAITDETLYDDEGFDEMGAPDSYSGGLKTEIEWVTNKNKDSFYNVGSVLGATNPGTYANSHASNYIVRVENKDAAAKDVYKFDSPNSTQQSGGLAPGVPTGGNASPARTVHAERAGSDATPLYALAFLLVACYGAFRVLARLKRRNAMHAAPGSRLAGERGASLIYALAFLLLATMVSVVMLSASTSAVASVHAEHQRTQDELTLRSAANLVRDLLEKADCKIVTKKNIDTGETTTEVLPVEGPLGDELHDALARAIGAAAEGRVDPADATGSFTVSLGDGGDLGELANTEVTVAYTLFKQQEEDDSETVDAFRIEAEFTLSGSEQRLFMTASRAASAAPTPVTEGGVTTTTETVNWDDVKLSTWKGDAS